MTPLSVWRTWMLPALYWPWGSTKLVPEPVAQVWPLSVLYCQVAPPTKPLTLMVPSAVMPSMASQPLSLDSDKMGACRLRFSANMLVVLVVLVGLMLPTASVTVATTV